MMRFQTLLKYELKKLFSNRLAVVLLAAASVLMLVLTGQRYITDPEERHAWETVQQIEGREMDEDFFSSLRAWYSENGEDSPGNPWRFTAVYLKQVFRYGSNQVTDAYETWDADSFYRLRQQAADDFSENFYLTENEMLYWKEKEAAIPKPFVYRCTNDIRRLRESYQFTLMMACVLIGIFLSDSFAGESAGGTEELISTGQYGQDHTLAAKLTAGIVLSLAAGCLLLISAHLPVIIFSGLHGLEAPWYLVEPFSGISVSAGQMILLHTLCFLSACMLTGLFTIFLSLWFNKTAAAMGTVFAVVVLDLFVSVPAHLRVLSQIRYLTPLSVLTNSRIQDLRLIRLFGKYLIPFQAGPILYIFSGMILLLLTILLYHRRKMKR